MVPQIRHCNHPVTSQHHGESHCKFHIRKQKKVWGKKGRNRQRTKL